MPSPDENFPHKNDRTFHQRCLSRARDEPAEAPLAPAKLMQERRNSIANALELRLSCTNPSIYIYEYLCIVCPSSRSRTCILCTGLVSCILCNLWHHKQAHIRLLLRPGNSSYIHHKDPPRHNACSWLYHKLKMEGNIRYKHICNKHICI